MRGGVLNKMSSEILNCSSKTDMQVADSVSTAGHAPTSELCPPPELPHQGVWEYLRAARQENTLCHVHTHLGVQSSICFFDAVIWSPWLTRFRCGDSSPKHDKASRSITELYLFKNQIGDDGARALADAVKAILVRWFSNRCAQAF